MPIDASAQSINGIGTRFYGHSRRDDEDIYTATKWFAILMCPIVPMARFRLRYLGRTAGFGGVRTRYEVLERQPLVPAEVLRTLLSSFLGVPLVVCAPAAVAGAVALLDIPPLTIAAVVVAILGSLGGLIAGAVWVSGRPHQLHPLPLDWQGARAQGRMGLFLGPVLGGVAALVFGALTFGFDLAEGATIGGAAFSAASNGAFWLVSGSLVTPAAAFLSKLTQARREARRQPL